MGGNVMRVEDACAAQRVLKDGTNLDRRSLFISAAAFGAVATSRQSRRPALPLPLRQLHRAGSS